MKIIVKGKTVITLTDSGREVCRAEYHTEAAARAAAESKKMTAAANAARTELFCSIGASTNVVHHEFFQVA